ncbi:unnamed protein product [Ectocarpus sp. 6 AP-2014]
MIAKAVVAAMACLVSLRGSIPGAQAFVTAATGRGFATTTTTAFARRHHHLGRHTAAAATTARPPTERSMTGSPATLMFSSVGGPAEAAMAAAAAAGAKHVLVPVADGSEEIESVTIIDTLVRAGALVTVASVGPEVEVTCSRGVKIKADCKIAECEARDWDAVVCPGGMPGAVSLKENETLEAILRKQNSEGRIVGAICAAPAVVLASHGLLEGKQATCYPASVFQSKIPQLVSEKVVVDQNLITSQGPATSMAFALQLVGSLFGQEKADEVAKGLLFN